MLILIFACLGSATLQAKNTADNLPLILDIGLIAAFTTSNNDPQTALSMRLLSQKEKQFWHIAPEQEIYIWEYGEQLKPKPRLSYSSGALYLGAEYEPWNFLTVQFLLFSGEIRQGSTLDPAVAGLAIDNQSISTDEYDPLQFIKELSLNVRVGDFDLKIGRQRQSVASGLVYDDYGTGISLNYEPKFINLRSKLFAVIVGQTKSELQKLNPLISLTISYDLSFFESISFVSAFYYNQNNNNSYQNNSPLEVINSVMAEQDMIAFSNRPAYKIRLLNPYGPEQLKLNLRFADTITSGYITYFGLSGDLIPYTGMSLRANIIISSGKYFDLHPIPKQKIFSNQTLDLFGYAFHTELHYGLAPNIDLGIFGVVLSGNSNKGLQNYQHRAFIGVAPYWIWTGLFFSGGINQGFYAGRAMAAGVNGHGVIAAGVSTELSNEMSKLELKATYLQAFSPAAPGLGGGGKIYGLELDFIASITPIDWLLISAEVDLLIPGNFFPQDKIGYRSILWANIAYAK